MSRRRITIKKGAEPCPKCTNVTDFIVFSEQVSEDCCNIWVKCSCGFDPTEEDTGSRIEDVWGGCTDDNCLNAMRYTWNDLVTPYSQ